MGSFFLPILKNQNGSGKIIFKKNQKLKNTPPPKKSGAKKTWDIMERKLKEVFPSMLHLFIYGTDDLYQVIAMETATSLTEAFAIAEEMSCTMRDISVVPARKGLKSDFMEAIHGGFDDKMAFMDMLKQESLWK